MTTTLGCYQWQLFYVVAQFLWGETSRGDVRNCGSSSRSGGRCD